MLLRMRKANGRNLLFERRYYNCEIGLMAMVVVCNHRKIWYPYDNFDFELWFHFCLFYSVFIQTSDECMVPELGDLVNFHISIFHKFNQFYNFSTFFTLLHNDELRITQITFHFTVKLSFCTWSIKVYKDWNI